MLEHRYRRVAVLAPMVSCQAAYESVCQQCTRWSGRGVRFDADAGSKAASQKYTQVKIMEITLFLEKEMSNPLLELFGWKIE